MSARTLLWSSLVLLAGCAGQADSGSSADLDLEVESDTSSQDDNELPSDTSSQDGNELPVEPGECPRVTFAVVDALDQRRSGPFMPFMVLAASMNTPDRYPEQFRWSVTNPDGTLAPIDTQALRPMFMPTSPGLYTFELELSDTTGATCGTLVREVTIATPSIHVVTTWRTPHYETYVPTSHSFIKPDLDLHLLSSGGDTYFDPRWDCFFENAAPDWGPAGPSDDPRLIEPWAIDEALEVIAVVPRQATVSAPISEETFRVGVHYWSDAGFGPSFATVQVFVGGVLRDTWAEVELKNGDLWESHHIDPVTGRVTRLMSQDGNPVVIPSFPIPNRAIPTGP